MKHELAQGIVFCSFLIKKDRKMKSSLMPKLTISNAAGTCKRTEDVRKLAASGVTEILLGSITLSPLPGNPGTNHYQSEDGSSINSLGLPNPGLDYYIEHLPEMREVAHASGKRLGLSIAPETLGGTEVMSAVACAAKVDIIELNAGCPNVWARGKQKKILSFRPRLLERHLDALLQARTASRHPLTIRVKLSPYSDPGLLKEVASLVGSFGTPKRRIVIVSTNTFANAFMWKWWDGKLMPAIPFGEHLGGFSGGPYRAIALGQIAQFRMHLPAHPLIGVGGISRGQHIREYLHFQVEGVQIGSAYYYTENARIFSDLLEELFYYP